MDENFEDMANTAEDYYQRQAQVIETQTDLAVKIATDREFSRQSQRLLSEENWRAGYDVSTEGALGDYPEDCGW